MTTNTTQQETATEERNNKPTHRVTFRRKLREGYAQPVELGGAWQNSKGGISFPVAGGSITIWPQREAATEEAGH